ncbi:MAG: endolytic transglycosylase MltG [Acidobacteria bacterium]|nr:endolytic transglycosylase MltG [Acidobacteriota bacterium]
MMERLKSSRGLILLAVLASLVTVSLLAWLMIQIYQPYRGYEGAHQQVVIQRGSTVPQIAGTLESHGIVRSSLLFEWYARFSYRPLILQAGEYRFEEPMNLPSVTKTLQAGLVHHYRVTIPEGLDMHEIAERFAGEGFGATDQFLEAMQRTALIGDWDPRAENSLEGYLFPDTYFLTRDISEEEIVQVMVANFRKAWTPERLKRAEELGFTTREVITLASLIEKETGLSNERSLISAVFHNRLRKNLKLECDPTVIYAVKLVKAFDGVINQSDLKLDSPYNTYLYPGLPAGPIANPGLASIDAALYPAEVDYLYFVLANEGRHIFSSNYRDHNQAVAQYQR